MAEAAVKATAGYWADARIDNALARIADDFATPLLDVQILSIVAASGGYLRMEHTAAQRGADAAARAFTSLGIDASRTMYLRIKDVMAGCQVMAANLNNP